MNDTQSLVDTRAKEVYENQDQVVKQLTVYTTTNYGKFKSILGNRPINKVHVTMLANKMEREGNRMPDDPGIINEKDEVLDGQHRLRACELKGWPFSYVVVQGLGFEYIKIKNTGNRNWSWKNYAESFAAQGNQHYKVFLELVEEFKDSYSVLTYYCNPNVTYATNGGGRYRGNNRFHVGDFTIKDISLTHQLLLQYHELADIAGVNSREFALAVNRFMRTPSYDHAVMVKKVEKFGAILVNQKLISDNLFALEQIWRTV